MCSSFQLPTPFLQNVQSNWTPQCLFKKCRVCLSTPFCFSKMQSSNEVPAVFYKDAEFISTPHAVFTKVCLNPPHCLSRKCQTNSLLCFPKMQSLFQVYALLQTDPQRRMTMTHSLHHDWLRSYSPLCFTNCWACLNSPLCFLKMQTSINVLYHSCLRYSFIECKPLALPSAQQASQ